MVKLLKGLTGFYRLTREPIGYLAGIQQLSALVFSIVGLFFGYETLAGTSTGMQPFSFPLRLILMIVCAIALGCGMGLGIIYLTKRNSRITRGLAFAVSVVWAGLLVVIVDALSLSSSNLPDFSLFTFAGLAFALGVLTFLFRASAQSVGIGIVEDRAGMMACFAATTAIVGLVVQIGRTIA